MFHDASIGNPVHISVVRLIFLEEEEVKRRQSGRARSVAGLAWGHESERVFAQKAVARHSGTLPRSFGVLETAGLWIYTAVCSYFLAAAVSPASG